MVFRRWDPGSEWNRADLSLYGKTGIESIESSWIGQGIKRINQKIVEENRFFDMDLMGLALGIGDWAFGSSIKRAATSELAIEHDHRSILKKNNRSIFTPLHRSTASAQKLVWTKPT
ncbi:hypothetical protein DY000_02025823 [Brassica cretica]|uniref:Uncharacterized protein n=1 Tax=Brassica cretica TaxID=69181 RepID=A0ABQ7EJT3_BRACR|nr:hypothetical protein DY000_02025823 [Brassica cretica]